MKKISKSKTILRASRSTNLARGTTKRPSRQATRISSTGGRANAKVSREKTYRSTWLARKS